MEKSVTILGSYCSRDSFNENILTNSPIKIKTYIQKSTPFTIFEKSIDIDYDKIIAENNFLKRCIKYDFSKETLSILKNNLTDYIIIDFADLRYSLIYITKDNFKTTITQTPYAKNTLYNCKDDLSSYSINYNNDIYWFSINEIKDHIKKFVNFIKNLYSPKQIILLNVINCIYYIDDDKIFHNFESQEKFIRENYLFRLVGKLFCKEFNNNIRVINIPEDVTANKNHHLGFSPLHYEDSCYEYIANCFYKIIMENGNQSDLDNLYEQYYDKLKIEKRKVKIRTSIANQNKKL